MYFPSYNSYMEKKDGRALPHAVREQIRKRAVSRVLDGESPEVVIESLGFHRSRIYDWLNQYRQRGEAGLETRPIPGRPKKFDDALWADELRELIRSDPRQLDFHDALWTRAMIRELLRRHFKAKVSERTVGNILKRLDITVQRPRLKAVEQDPEIVQRWLNENWPAIRAAAKADNAVIFFGDESNLRSDAHRGTTWGVKGETPVVPKTGRRFSLNLISAVSPLGELRFMVTDQRVNASVFIDFLRRLLVNAERPIYLVLDGHPVHRSKKVRDFVARQDGRLKLFFLPPYSPELNPDELVWNVVKGQVSGKTVVEDKQTLHRLVRSALIRLQRSTDKLRKLFHEPNVTYILDECRV
jgi:transposase